MVVNSKLAQLLGYLDREDVGELVIGVGRPIAVRSGDAYQSLTSAAVSRPQLDLLLADSPLDRLIDVASHPVDLEIGGRLLRVEVQRPATGEPVLRISKRVAEIARPAPAPTVSAAEVAPVAASPVTPAHRVAARFAPQVARAPEPVAVEDGPETLTLAPDEASAPAESSLGAPDEPVVGAIVDERSDISNIAALVRQARQSVASDLHIAAGSPVLVRVLGELKPLEGNARPMSAAEVDSILLPLLGPMRRHQLATVGYVDLALDIRGAGRLRANVSRQQGGLRGALRLAAVEPPTLAGLGLPKELAKVVAHHQGLVVIAGPSGHGKTTTLAALVNLINSTKPFHIITIEDPVEIEHPRKQALISQREVGRHTKSFVSALKGSLREDPDVIVIGELRDRETVEIALTAAETGHLVLATMSTPSAAKTISRLIDMFPPDDQSQVRASIAGALRAIVAQRLLPAARGDGMVPAIELVTGVLPLAVLIRDDKLYQLPNLMQRGRAFGMIRMDESLLELVRTGRISEEVAREASDQKRELSAAIAPPAPAPQPNPSAISSTTSKIKTLFGRKDKE